VAVTLAPFHALGWHPVGRPGDEDDTPEGYPRQRSPSAGVSPGGRRRAGLTEAMAH
jgi:hypothetical protein